MVGGNYIKTVYLRKHRMNRFFIFLFLVLGTSANAQQPDIAKLGLKPPATPACTPVRDQSMSGTCWSFASNSLLEAELLRKGQAAEDLSEMFTARYSYIRKVYRYLETKGQVYFTPGGQFHDVLYVLRNYGMVPDEAYSGLTGNRKSHDHAELDTLMSRFVQAMLAEGKTKPSEDDMKTIDQWLDRYLGEVPSTFSYKGKIYTPQSYAASLAIKPDDYIEITSYTHHPFYTNFVLEDKYNWTGDSYYNVPVEDLIKITQAALKKGFTVGWDGDVTEPTFRFQDGLAFLWQTPANLQQTRQATFKSGETTIDHLMHIVGITTDNKGKTWYYVKNSWGTGNPADGYMYMQEDYFNVKTVAVIVAKDAVGE
jgi:bleomycin hydrolase